MRYYYGIRPSPAWSVGGMPWSRMKVFSQASISRCHGVASLLAGLDIKRLQSTERVA
jgi:hypothetical protein